MTHRAEADVGEDDDEGEHRRRRDPAAEQEAVALDNIPGYDEETRALYAGGLTEGEPGGEILAE